MRDAEHGQVLLEQRDHLIEVLGALTLHHAGSRQHSQAEHADRTSETHVTLRRW
jgi:hypothetical protein